MSAARIAFGLCLLGSGEALALGPADVYVIVNKNVPASKVVADYYCAKRGVPKKNVITLSLTANDDISRASYEENVVRPLRALLKEKRDKVKVLVTTYGVPLRVGRDDPTPAEQKELDKLAPELKALYKKRDELYSQLKLLQGKPEAAAKRREHDTAAAKVHALEARRNWLQHSESVAAFDSELALLWQPRYELRRWVDNLLYFRVSEARRAKSPPVVMTARLDGPSLAVVKRMIDDAIAAEARGLKGRVYVDAQGLTYNPASDPLGLGYAAYDESFREMATLLGDAGMAVTLDNKKELFAPGSCPKSALYAGWYSHAKYIPSNKFVQGAVGYHLASSEALRLHNPRTTFWCPNMLEDGACAVLGPVSEPYTLAFPKPAEFFGFLVTGEYTLVECYWRSLRFGSWMMVLLGDPLYKPFGRAPKLRSAQVKPSPAGAR
jgi:uncharacterized protein (TIGR03790 family)